MCRKLSFVITHLVAQCYFQGWDICKSCDMNTFFNFLPEEEQKRVNKLEPFDEYEEWHLKCSHYSILCAFKGQSKQLAAHMLPCSKMSDVPLHALCELRIEEKRCSTHCLRRFAFKCTL